MISLDHVALAVRDVSEVLATLVGELGATVMHGGASIGFRAMQLDAGACAIELIEPWDVEANDFLARFIERSGEGPHHLTFKTDDIRRELKRIEDAGYHPTGVNIDNPWWREAFIHPKEAGGTVVQIAQSDVDPKLFDAEVGRYGPGKWWPDPPPQAEPRCRLERVVVATDDIERSITLYEDLLGGRTADYGDGFVDLDWAAGGQLRIEMAAGRTEGIDRLEWSHDGPPRRRTVAGARFVFYAR